MTLAIQTESLNLLLESIKYFGKLDINIYENPKICRGILKKLSSLSSWKDIHAAQVRAIEIPTDDYMSDEEEIILIIANLPKLETCSLIGGRHGSKGRKCNGRLKSLPDEFQSALTILHVDLSFNIIVEVPQSISCFKNLRTLILDYNRIQILPHYICELINLEELYIRNNLLHSISDDIHKLRQLRIFKVSSNSLNVIPDVFHIMKALLHLDVSNNQIQELPLNIFRSPTLQILQASHNNIEFLPDFDEEMPIDLVDVQYNYVVNVPNHVARNPHVLLNGNISRYHTANLTDECSDDYEVDHVFAMPNICTISVEDCEGACYELSSGVKIVIPHGFVCDVTEIYCNVTVKEVTDFKLRATDQLLSAVLSLTPNGIAFAKPVRITLPYTYSGVDKQKREIIMRVTSFVNGSFQYEDLRSEISNVQEDGGLFGHGNVTAHTKHFSMFAVVSRLVEDTIELDTNSSKTMFSSVHDFTKLHFPEGSVNTNTTITMQILSVSQTEVEEITRLPQSCASNVLHVHVMPENTVFLQPVTVHLALPPGLMGKTFDKNHLHLMKSGINVDEWEDVTNNVDLVFSTVDVSFQVNSFSRFWLMWSNVCGVARKVYKRIITYKVQFLAMQKKTLPCVIIAQCVRENQVRERIQQLINEGYSGEDSYTIIQELIEGDQFRVKVRGDMKIKSYGDTDTQHMEEKVLVRRFHSQYTPEKSGFCRFCVEPISDATKTVFGRVSFYRIVPKLCGDRTAGNVTNDTGRLLGTKRTHDSNDMSSDVNRDDVNIAQPISKRISEEETCYLDDVIISLEAATTLILPQDKEYSLSFGELGTGMFKESNLQYLANEIDKEWQEIGHYLGLRTVDMERIKLDYPGQTKEQIYQMLRKWANRHMYDEDCVSVFTQALNDADRGDLAQRVQRMFKEGSENFQKTIKRRKDIPAPTSF